MVRIIEGFARKISLIFVGLSFIGWIVFTAGFGHARNEDVFKYTKEKFLYAFWAGSVVGPFAHIAAVVHILLWGILSSISGSVTAVLSLMYLSAIGYVMVLSGQSIDAVNDYNGTHTTEVELLFAGGFITTLFWTIHLALWPWFRKEDRHKEKASNDYSTF